MARTDHKDKDLGVPIQYDPDFNGPLKHRSCTDVICLLMFFVFIGCWIAVGGYAYANGNPEVLLVPKDSQGGRCGFDEHVKDRPYLFFFDLTKCLGASVPFVGCDTPQVCVEKCPTANFYWPKGTEPGVNNKLSNIFCIEGVIPTEDTVQKLIETNKCARWHLKSFSVLKRCIPTIDDYTINFIKNHTIYIENLNQANIIAAIKNVKWYAKAEQVGHDIVDDIESCWIEVVGGVAFAVLFCIIYIAMMRWIAGFMVWLSIIATVALLVFCQYQTVVNYIYYKDHPLESENASSTLQSYLKDETFWMVLLIIVAVVLSILVLLLIFLRKRIVLAIALIREGSRAVSAATSTLCFPIVPWILQIAVIIFSISVALYLASTGDPVYKTKNFDASCRCDQQYTTNGQDCSPALFANYCKTTLQRSCRADCSFERMNYGKLTPYLHAFNIFGYFWAVFFISALGEMILAATFATWYWTFKKTNVPFFTLTSATLRTLRYHMGTLAFGSLIIAICRIIRVGLEYVDRKLKKYDNEITKAIMCCCKCFFWCLEKFLKFINKNAYIMCAIHGKNFCGSAKDAFSLLLRNCIRVFVLDKVTDFLFFLSKLVVTIIVSCIVYTFVEYVREKELNYNFVPVVFVAICTYLIAAIFFSVYTMAVDTLFLCFLEDSERNDGSAEKPYFMSKNLMNILGKKNKMC